MTAKITEKFRYYLSLNEFVSECVFVSRDGRYIQEQNYHADGDQTEWQNEDFRTKAYQLVCSADRPVILASEEISGKYAKEPACYIGIQIVDSKEVIGEVFFGISKEIFRSSSFVEMDTMDETVP